jgi:hypothetical protein
MMAMRALGKAVRIQYEQAPGAWMEMDGLVTPDGHAEFEVRGIVGPYGSVSFEPEKRYPIKKIPENAYAFCRFCGSGWEASDARGNCRACGAPKGMALTTGVRP